MLVFSSWRLLERPIEASSVSTTRVTLRQETDWWTKPKPIQRARRTFMASSSRSLARSFEHAFEKRFQVHFTTNASSSSSIGRTFARYRWPKPEQHHQWSERRLFANFWLAWRLKPELDPGWMRKKKVAGIAFRNIRVKFASLKGKCVFFVMRTRKKDFFVLRNEKCQRNLLFSLFL